ncbi:MAG: hypothetical protein RXR20_25300 [Paraburkholderia sp.]|jgi:hypothetical protein|uniref:hypothetical protein n=1 Tax=Burkholderiaceae TaxID=119060 RepID=UPI0010F6D9F4|nr:hypothetical protein [Burkholderia sp. 4M9327F10]
MKIPKMGCGEVFLVALIVLTTVMWLRDRLPASAAEIRGMQALAASNEAAQRVVASRLADGSSLSSSDVRRLRERVVAIEAYASRPAPGVATRRLTLERERLAARPFLEMTGGDKLRWMLFGIGRYAELIIGALAGLGALAFIRLRGNRGERCTTH